MDGMTVPVVPGREQVAEGPCALCGAEGGRRMFVVIGHADTVVCVDSLACVNRAVGS